ncbi:ABC-2 type transport system permease protein [Sporobacter termitidis DSM 10068]|uniref:ABC-2 type transport system permease protein n=1 Tax=Sporobacter termitidis DSM 10068 TaxID=1123282 RepID=A0A1M5Z9V5_9FIRM|nr:ABC transporter permease [Sporobacter termitidis]SHI21026.1 ABC-2 type transport system permease protein [Sporobacter termitidis DSM 10068]
MQIFKAYFKVLNRHKMSMMIYFIVFIVITLLIMGSIKSLTATTFSQTKSNIVVLSDDTPSPLTDGLRGYLAQNANIIDIEDDPETVQDALFYGNVAYVLRIPAGFAESFIGGTGALPLQKTVSASGAVGMNLDLLIDKYLNLAALYEKSLPGLDQSDIAARVLNDLSVAAAVDYNTTKQTSDTAAISYYFRINAYPTLAILIMGIMTIMITFNEPDVNRRNLCSPVSPMKMNMQMFLGNAAFAGAVWSALCIMTFILYGAVPAGAGVALLCLNSLVFTVASLSLGFVLGKFLKSSVAMAAATNVVSLGMCFLSGVFVDQEALGSSVQTIGSFTPGYWYIKAVNAIRDMSVYSAQNLRPVFYDILIELGFALAFVAVALVATKQKRQTLES